MLRPCRWGLYFPTFRRIVLPLSSGKILAHKITGLGSFETSGTIYPAILFNTAKSLGLEQYLLTCPILTYSTVQSTSLEANWFAASQEIPRISRNPKVHYRTHKRPPPVSILGQPNPVHIPTSHLPEIRSNIIHPSMPRSPHWSPSLRFPHQDPIHPLSSPIRATCPAHLILLDFMNNTQITTKISHR